MDREIKITIKVSGKKTGIKIDGSASGFEILGYLRYMEKKLWLDILNSEIEVKEVESKDKK